MDARFAIGNASVWVRHWELLTGTLAGLTRRPRGADAPPDATLDIELGRERDWELDVVAHGDTHSFGRPTYVFHVEPRDRLIRIVMTTIPEGNDLYWFQRDLFGTLACMSGELMLHGSALVAPDGGAWVFCGASGAGKSTICRMLTSKGLQAINDEVNWLFFDADNELRIVNQPFWLSKSDEDVLPVTRFHLLRQGDSCALRPPLARIETFTSLLAGHLSIDNMYDFLKTRAMALKRLVEESTIEVLEFNLDAEALIELLWKDRKLKNS